MARAFIASVPMGVVLVAALVVPLAVIPGTFGFDSWPSSRGASVTERQVRLGVHEARLLGRELVALADALDARSFRERQAARERARARRARRRADRLASPVRPMAPSGSIE